MTKKYPLLTKENVNHWYWVRKPAWSGLDIAKKVNCKPATVYEFMERNGIVRRTYKKASKNMHACEWKHENFLNAVQSEDHKDLLSEIAYEQLLESYPLLTVSNVKRWYWEEDPKWSGHDIADHVGCSVQTVYNFMERYEIPIRSYKEAVKHTYECPRKISRIMDVVKKDFPLLTKENVFEWYCNSEPLMSITEIADKIGCSTTTVNRFMREHEITIRNKSESSKLMFTNPEIKEKHKSSHSTDEFRKRQSIITKEAMNNKKVRGTISQGRKNAWKDPKKRKKMLKGIQTYHLSRLSNKQKIILNILKKDGGKTVYELKKSKDLSLFSLSAIRGSIGRLCKRLFVEKKWIINPETKRKLSKYYINTKGKQLI